MPEAEHTVSAVRKQRLRNITAQPALAGVFGPPVPKS